MVYCYFTEKQLKHVHVSLNLITFRVIDFFPPMSDHICKSRERILSSKCATEPSMLLQKCDIIFQVVYC